MYNFNPFPSLTSHRLRLRRLDLTDQNEIFQLRSDERVNQFLDRQPAQSMEDAVVFINKINDVIDRNESLYWVICLKENPKAIGTICLYSFSPTLESAEIGFELHPFYHGKGIMQEACATVIQYGFQVLQLKAITGFPSSKNLASIKLLHRNGFKQEDDGSDPRGDFVRFVLNRESTIDNRQS